MTIHPQRLAHNSTNTTLAYGVGSTVGASWEGRREEQDIGKVYMEAEGVKARFCLHGHAPPSFFPGASVLLALALP